MDHGGLVVFGGDYLKKELKQAKKRARLAAKMQKTMDKAEALNEQQKIFCLEYVSCNNATQAYIKAYGCSYNAARASAYRLLTNADIQAEIGRLRALMRDAYDVQADDMIRFCLRVVGANIGDYVSFPAGGLPALKESENADMALVEEVCKGPGNGFRIRLIDKRWAWDKLDKYFHWTGTGKDTDNEINITITNATKESVQRWRENQ